MSITDYSQPPHHMNARECLIFLCFIIILVSPVAAMAYDKIAVCVSILPQKYFVQQIGQDRVDIQVMVQPGASPATYEPKPRQMVAFSKARAYFSIGVPFEYAWLQKIAATNPKMLMVQTDAGIEKIPLSAQLPGKAHHHKEGHGERGLDPHIWLSPTLVKTQADSILTTMQRIDPSNASEYQRNYERFISRLEALDAELKSMFAEQRGLQFMVFHPSWGYFAHAYGLKQIPIEIEGKNPKPAQLKRLVQHAREKGIRVIFAQPQFSSKSADLVARLIGGKVIFADPLAEDWLASLRKVAREFREALK
jgi:zinc transport system substrate-binding protein